MLKITTPLFYDFTTTHRFTVGCGAGVYELEKLAAAENSCAQWQCFVSGEPQAVD